MNQNIGKKYVSPYDFEKHVTHIEYYFLFLWFKRQKNYSRATPIPTLEVEPVMKLLSEIVKMHLKESN